MAEKAKVVSKPEPKKFCQNCRLRVNKRCIQGYPDQPFVARKHTCSKWESD